MGYTFRMTAYSFLSDIVCIRIASQVGVHKECCYCIKDVGEVVELKFKVFFFTEALTVPPTLSGALLPW